jgi:hypothetical protein
MISNLKDNTNDERIVIRPTLVKAVDGDVSMEYNVTHDIPSSMIHTNEHRSIKMNFRSIRSLVHYIDSLLALLRVDEGPYASIQFDLPMLPSILVSPKNLTYNVQDHIIDHIKLLNNAWPVVPLPPSRRGSVTFGGSKDINDNENPSCSNSGGSGCFATNKKPNKHIFFHDELDTKYHTEYYL